MYYVGIDLGGTNIAAGLVDEEGKIVAKKSVPTRGEREEDEIIKDMAMVAIDVIKENGVSFDDVKSIGVGSPGSVNKTDGVIVSANNLKFKNTKLREKIQKYIDKPVYVDNDANCAAWAEALAGAAKGVEDSIMITLGTGVGGGIIVNGKLYSGFNFYGGELGHGVICVDGVPCSCGRNGCWEAYSSATGLVRITKEHADKDKNSILWDIYKENGRFSGRSAFEAARKGDKAAKDAVNEYLKYLAEGLANIINIFQPEVLVIGGGVSNEGKDLFEPLNKLVFERTYTKNGSAKQTKIVKAFLGNDAGIVGAALLQE